MGRLQDLANEVMSILRHRVEGYQFRDLLAIVRCEPTDLIRVLVQLEDRFDIFVERPSDGRPKTYRLRQSMTAHGLVPATG